MIPGMQVGRVRARLPKALWRASFSLVVVVLLGCWQGCSRPQPSEPSSGLSTLTVTLPNGAEIQAELALTPEEQARGLMFRSALPPGEGMLFAFTDLQRRAFWMYQTRIPLDIIWMDAERRIVEISADTPPCQEPYPSDCPSYGGSLESQYVLELAGGQAAEYGLQVGDQLSF